MVNTISSGLSGLSAASKQLQASTNNIANLTTTGSLSDPSRAPYTPQTSVQGARAEGGVDSALRERSSAPYSALYDPRSSLADPQGFVGTPNINLAEEVVNLKLAALTYKANLQTIKVGQDLSEELLNIFDEDV